MSEASSISTDATFSTVLTRMLGSIPDSIKSCDGGGNNRVFRVEHAGHSYLAKSYFTSASDTRDRLDSEWQFLSYCQQIGVDNVPRPVARDDASAMALYSFLDGARPATSDINAETVRQAGRFIHALNTQNTNPAAQTLPLASESCFTANEHIELLRKRIERLKDGVSHSEHTTEFQALWEKINSAFTHHANALLSGYAALHIAPDQELPQSARILSPSDFGFHNSLLPTSGRLQFIDFEYAGWDDPAKMLCDFFLHPGITVSPEWAKTFWQEISPMPVDLSQTLARARLLYPLFCLRWCCIILNVFIPDWAARRQFADNSWDVELAQKQQLDKAEHMLYTMENNPFKELN